VRSYRVRARLAAVVAGTVAATALVALPATASPSLAALALPQSALALWGSPTDNQNNIRTPQIVAMPGGLGVTAAAAGYGFDLALGSDANVYAWGSNDAGQLGNGTTSDSVQATPTQVPLPQGISAQSVATNSNEFSTALAVGTNGDVYGWGDNADCQLGDPAPQDSYVLTPRKLPVGNAASAVAVGLDHVLVLGASGQVYGFGDNEFGQLGDDAAGNESCTPVQVPLPAGVTATAVAAGDYSSYAVGSDGLLYAWGADNYGQLGDGTAMSHRSTPEPVTLPAGVRAISVAAGSGFVLVLVSDGTVYAFGDNELGQLGIGSSGGQLLDPTPVTLPGNVRATAVAAGPEDALILGIDGVAYTAGEDDYGQLGDGNWVTSRSSFQPVVMPGASVVISLSASSYHGLAVLSGSIAPQFTQASPPTTAPAGSHIDYTFAASGLPAPSYALAGAPSWLSIDSTSGELTGTIPAGATSFTFSVTATNTAGSTTTGPLTVTVPAVTVPVSGTVTIGGGPAVPGNGSPIPGAVVDVCVVGGTVCTSDTTDAEGQFTSAAAMNSTVTVAAYPSPGSGFDSSTTTPLSVGSGGLTAVTITLVPTQASIGPDVKIISGQVATTITGTPVFNWTELTDLQITSCPDGAGMLTLVGQNSGTGAYEDHAYPVTEESPRSGIYEALLPPQIPIHGPVDIEHTVTCAGAVGIAPESGLTSGGENVVVSGSGFTGATAVQFGANPASDLDVLSDGLLTVTAPPGAGTVPVVVTLASGDDITAGNYTYLAAGDLPSLDLDAYRAATAPAAATSSEVAAAPAHVTELGATAVAGGSAELGSLHAYAADAAMPDLAQIVKWVYNHFPGASASTLRSAVDTAIAALHPSCDSDRAALTAAAHLLAAAPIKAVAVAATPSLTIDAEILLSALVDPIVAALFAPLVATLVKTAVSLALNKLLDAIIDAGITAALGNCPHPTNALIDPSGTVLDTLGNPVSGATVTIQRSDNSTGPFAAVDVTKPGIEPATNPETTAADGTFHWDVDAGYYEVQATKPGCTVPGDPDQDVATIGPYPVPPPQVGLTITLACPDDATAPTPIVQSLSVASGPPTGGTGVTVSGSGFTPSATVSVGGTAAAAVTYLGPKAIEITTPAGGPGLADVVVHTAGGDSATGAADQFFFGTTPVITGLSTTEGPAAGGTQLTITGSGFTGANEVGFAGIPGAGLTVLSDTTLTVSTPAAASPGVVDIEVVTPIGANVTGPPAQFTYTAVVPSARAQTISFPVLADMTYGDPNQALTATASSGLAVTFTAGAGQACTVDGGNLRVTGAGTCTVTATQAGDGQYLAAAAVTQTISIAKAVLTVTAGNATMTSGGQPPVVRPGYAGFVNADTPAVLDTPPTCAADTATKTTTCSGGADADYTFHYVPGTLTIQSAPNPPGGHQPTMTLSASTVAAGGTETITATGFAPAEKVEATLHSASVDLGASTTDARGYVRFTVRIPTTVAHGEHHLTLTGERSGRSVTVDLTVTAASWPLPHTGVNFGSLFGWGFFAKLFGCGLTGTANHWYPSNWRAPNWCRSDQSQARPAHWW